MIPPSGGQGGLHSLIFQHNSKDSVLLFPDLTKKLILNNDQNNLNFILNNLDYHSPENAVYQYVLFKNNDTLSVIEKPELTHGLRFLEAGNYRLEVSGLSEQFKKLSYNFEILKPFWQRWWFWAIILAIISALVYYQIRLSMKRASMELRALQGQMNAHFAANFMETVKNLVLREDKLKAFNVLSMFGGLMRNFVVASRSKQTTVEEEVEFLKRYIQLAKLVYNLQKTEEYDKTLTDMVVVEDGVDLKTRIRSLLIQPIVENAFKYGIFHKEAESQLLIRFEPNNSKTIRCIIEDDGVGRKRVAEIQAQENKDLQLLGAKTIDTKGSIETMREAGVKIKVIDLPQGLRIEMLLEILN